jgi:hypothetical protein
LGTNNPYPDGVGALGPGEDEPPYLPTPVISDAELFRRDAHRRLAERQHARQPRSSARSWMEEPGAMEAAGLVDDDARAAGSAQTNSDDPGGRKPGA